MECGVDQSWDVIAVRQALNSRDVWLSAWNGVMEEIAAQQEPPLDFAAWVAQKNRAPAGSPCNSAWLPSWLPIAGDDGGNDLFVDLRPGPAHGCMRAFRRDGGAGDAAWWGGVADMLADIAAALAQGTSSRGDRVQAGQDGRICWETDEEPSRRRGAREEPVDPPAGGTAPARGMRTGRATTADVLEGLPHDQSDVRRAACLTHLRQRCSTQGLAS